MTSRREPLHLRAFLYPGGHHVAAWRHPSAQADAGVNAAHYRRIAQVAEAAKFDLGADLSAYPDDAPVPDLPETEGGRSRQALILTLARREGLTIRELSLRIAGARGHWTLVGTASRIADALQERFEAYGADGFNIMPPTLPGGLDDFAALVIPELQRRGLFRTDYAGRTLRASRPAEAAPPRPVSGVAEGAGFDRPAHRAQVRGGVQTASRTLMARGMSPRRWKRSAVAC